MSNVSEQHYFYHNINIPCFYSKGTLDYISYSYVIEFNRQFVPKEFLEDLETFVTEKLERLDDTIPRSISVNLGFRTIKAPEFLDVLKNWLTPYLGKLYSEFTIELSGKTSTQVIPAYKLRKVSVKINTEKL